jgi:hypothetical protein
MNRRFTKVAVLAATAMTLSLATPVSAQAADTAAIPAAGSAPQGSSALTTTPSVASASALGKFSMRHAAISRKGDNTVRGTISPAVSGSNFSAEVRVNGKYKGRVPLYSGGIYYPGTWRAGAVKLGPVYYTDSSGAQRIANQYSNAFRVRQAVTWKTSPIVKRGSKITFKLKGFKTFNGTKWVSVKKVKLQVKKGKKWKSIKNVKVNSKGNRNYVIKHKKKRAYRVYIPTTKRVKGAATGGTRI